MQPQSETSGGVGNELRSNAQQVGSSAVNRLHSEVDARKGTAASQARSVSSAIDRASGELDESAPAWLKSAFQQGAQQVQRFADAIEQKDSRQLVEEVSSFARTSPGTFLAGCAAAGFAAARLFRAGAEGSASAGSPQGGSNDRSSSSGGLQQDSGQYRSSFETTYGQSGMQSDSSSSRESSYDPA
jgi:hypothetical protein